MKTLNKAFLIVLGLLLAAALFWALRPAPVEVSAVRAERGPFRLTVEEEGRTHLRDTYLISAPIGGFLHRVSLEPGDAVSAGQTVFELEPPPAPALDARTREQARESLAAAEARLEAARAERENRRADQQLARSELARAQRLFDQSLIAESELERAQNAAARARSALAVAEASLEAAGYEVSNARAVLEIAEGERSIEGGAVLAVAAPVGGVVLSRERCCEGPIQAGAPVLEIGRLDELEVRVDLLSMDAVRVEAGTRVLIEDWGGETVLEGRVRRVEPAGFMRVSALGVEEQRVPVLVEITSPREQWQSLGTGFRVEARFILWAGDDVLQVPSSALFRQGEGWAVFVVEDGRLSTRVVEPGRESGLMREITDGLSAGEAVVAHPSDALEEGLRVESSDA
jgi:HlyD family secretion protein